MVDKAFDVVGLGNAIVDVVAYTEDGFLEEAGLAKGAMTLVDEARCLELYERLGPAHEVSGGSCANTMAALAALGGRAAFIGRVRDDELGHIFTHDIRAAGVHFTTPPSPEGPPTARCLVFVTPDAQRTMATYLGACVELSPADLDPDLLAQARILYLEGYLWDRPEAKAACLEAARVVRESGGQVALTLSDPFCVERWREEFRELVAGPVDILFANEAEITRLYETESFEQAVAAVRGRVAIAALTRSADGSVVVTDGRILEIPAYPPTELVDTTGAGDLYAAGFLRGLTGGLDLARAGRLGALCATTIIAQWGARPTRPLRPLWEQLVGEGQSNSPGARDG